MPRVADWSFATFTPSQIRAAGFVGVIRYLSPPPNPKNWTAAQINQFRSAQFWLGFVWETSTTRASEGFAAGQTDAVRANRLADDLGVPAHVAIYYAVDERSTAPTAVKPYFQGIGTVDGRPIGVYGSKEVCEAVTRWGHARYMWMVETWWDAEPRPLRHPDVHLVQIANWHSLDGTDDNEVMKADWGGWRPGEEGLWRDGLFEAVLI